MTMPGRSYNAHTYRHGFTGHEKESDLAEGIYTTEYRLYDARVGRWLSVDPLFEKYVGMSPYNYCMLNPVVMVDPDGRAVYGRENEDGTLSYAILDNTMAQNIGFVYSSPEGGDYQYIDSSYDYDGKLIAKEKAKSYGESDFDNWSKNAYVAKEMFYDWINGEGAENKNFDNEEVANSFKNAWKVQQARDYFYNKYANVPSYAGCEVSNFKGNFGLEGLIRAFVDPIEQYVGSYSIDISVVGKELQFTLKNNTSFKSFFYGIGSDWERSEYKRCGNMRQTYIFYEPLKK